MKPTYLTVLTIILLSISCVQKEPLVKEYKNWSSESNRPSVELEIKEFDSYKKLVDKIERLFCSDTIPRLVFKDRNIIKRIDALTICPDVLAHPRNRNTIYFINGELVKNEKKYSLDSLTSIMQKDYFNFGSNPEHADDPEWIIIIIKNKENYKISELEKILNHITDSYENIEIKQELQTAFFLPLPPPPPPPEE